MKKLNYTAPICGTGYGLTSIHLLKHLKNTYDITVFPIGQMSPETKQDHDIIIPMHEKNKEFETNATCIKIWHQFDLASRIGRGKYFGFPIFELDKFSDNEKNHMRSCDHLFVCSNWAKQVVQNQSLDLNIDVIPLGVDTSVFDCNIKVQDHSDKYVFLSIGKWEKRKSHDILIDCFNKAFSKEDNVELWLATYNPFLNESDTHTWLSLVKNSKLYDKIKVFNRLQTQHDLAFLIQHSSCGVYLSRAEGWNLELLETIVMNKPVIATNYSGHTEFCTDKNSFLVSIETLEKAHDDKWFFGNGNWAHIGQSQIDQIVDYMQMCYRKKITSNPGYLATKNKFTWENSANQLIKCIGN